MCCHYRNRNPRLCLELVDSQFLERYFQDILCPTGVLLSVLVHWATIRRVQERDKSPAVDLGKCFLLVAMSSQSGFWNFNKIPPSKFSKVPQSFCNKASWRFDILASQSQISTRASNQLGWTSSLSALSIHPLPAPNKNLFAGTFFWRDLSGNPRTTRWPSSDPRAVERRFFATCAWLATKPTVWRGCRT